MQSLIFDNIKKLASGKNQGKIDAVLTVPANWNYTIRQYLVNSAIIAGINVMGVTT